MKCVEIIGFFSDQTGGFPKTSNKGSKYIMVMYDADSNAMPVEPIKSRAEHELLRAITKIHKHLTTRGLKLSAQIHNNKCAELIKERFQKNTTAFQLFPPSFTSKQYSRKSHWHFQRSLRHYPM